MIAKIVGQALDNRVAKIQVLLVNNGPGRLFPGKAEVRIAAVDENESGDVRIHLEASEQAPAEQFEELELSPAPPAPVLATPEETGLLAPLADPSLDSLLAEKHEDDADPA